MKKLIAVLISAIAIIVIVYFYLSPDSGTPRAVADSFFEALNQENFEEAHKYMTNVFHESTSDMDLVSFLENNELVNFRLVEWEEPRISEKLAEVIGEVETAKGQEAYIKVNFIKEDDRWKIMNFQRIKKGYVTPTSAQNLPPESELKELLIPPCSGSQKQ